MRHLVRARNIDNDISIGNPSPVYGEKVRRHTFSVSRFAWLSGASLREAGNTRHRAIRQRRARDSRREIVRALGGGRVTRINATRLPSATPAEPLAVS